MRKEGVAGGGWWDTMQIARLANVREHWLVGPIEVGCTYVHSSNNRLLRVSIFETEETDLVAVLPRTQALASFIVSQQGTERELRGTVRAGSATRQTESKPCTRLAMSRNFCKAGPVSNE